MGITVLDAYKVVTISAANAWVDVNVADYFTIPAGGVSGVFVEVVAPQNHVFGLRKNGSTDTIKGACTDAAGAHVGYFVGVDANGIFELYSDTTSLSFFLITAYTTRGFTFFTNAVTPTATTYSSWTNLDCSAYVPVTAIAIVFRVYVNYSVYTLGLRNDGCGDSITGKNLAGEVPFTMMIGCTSQIVEYYKSDSHVIFSIVGYVDADSGGTFPVDKTDYNYSTATTGSWADLTALPVGHTVGLFECTTGANAGNTFAMRQNGSSATYHSTNIAGISNIIQQGDDSRIIETWIDNANMDYYLVGFFLEPAANPCGGGVAVGDCMII